MATWKCADCTADYSVGAPQCPQCGSSERAQGVGTVLPSLTVACMAEGCMHHGKPRRVHLRTAAPGVLEMPNLVCAGCGAATPQVPARPDVNEPEDDMPKIHANREPTNRYEDEPAHEGEHGPETVDMPADAAVHPTSEESEQPSAGSSSETSSEKQPTPSETSKPSPQPPARTTGSRSGKARTGSSSARGTDGGQETGTSGSDEAAE